MAKTQTVADVMTPDPVTIDADAPIREAALAMRDENIGDIVVTQDGDVCGIVTDRDIVVRAVADQKDPATTRLGDVCSKDLTMLSPDSSVGDAVRLMREKALRRLPVVQEGQPVGIVSLGDLAIERDRFSALADISDAPANA